MEHKTLDIPRIAGLNALLPDEAIRKIADEGVRAEIDTINWPEFPSGPATTLFAAHSGDTLYLLYRVKEGLLVALHAAEQSAVSDDSCVEAFLKPDGEERYRNIEFNCIGAANAAYRLSRHEYERMDSDTLARIRRSGTYVGHPIFDEKSEKGDWELCMAIPLDIIGVDATKGPVHLTGNFYSCAGDASVPYYLTWNPIAAPKPDYHRPECFGDITLL